MKSNDKKPKEVKTLKRANVLDSLAYALTQIALAVLSVAGVKFYLQPVDEILSTVFAVSLVSAVLYISFKNR